jgi:hypothetical protein
MEVMISVVVVGVAITAICQGLASGTHLSGVSTRTTTAALLAEELVSQMETGAVDFLTEGDGDFAEDDVEPNAAVGVEGYRWFTRVEDGGLDDLYEVTIIVYWADRFDEETTRSVQLVRYFYKPEEEETEEESS